jgi:hypothetical protein
MKRLISIELMVETDKGVVARVHRVFDVEDGVFLGDAVLNGLVRTRNEVFQQLGYPTMEAQG